MVRAFYRLKGAASVIGKILKAYKSSECWLLIFQFKIHLNLRPESGQENIGPVTLTGADSRDYFRIKGTNKKYASFSMTKLNDR